MVNLFIVLFIILSLLVFQNFNEKSSKIIYIVIGAILVLIAGFRGEGVDKDYENYLYAFYNTDTILEFSFNSLSSIIKFFSDSPLFIFVFYAIIGVTVNLIAIKRITELYLLSLLVYFSWFFILHEMTQIRIGVSCAFLLLSIKPLFQRNTMSILLLFSMAVFFHYSALIILLLLFINPNNFDRNKWIWIVPLGYLIHYLGFNLLSYLPISFLTEKIEIYEELNSSGLKGFSGINVSNPVYLSNIAIYYFLLFNIEKIYLRNKYVYLLLKIYGLALFMFTSLSFITVIASRYYEFFGVVQIILLPLIYYTFKRPQIAKLVIWVYTVFSLWVMLDYNQLIV